MTDTRPNPTADELRARLARLLSVPLATREYDAIVSHIEVNDRHGVGVVLRMLFKDRADLLCVRSRNFFDGDNQLGDRHVRIDHADDADRSAAFAGVVCGMTGLRARRVLCVPYYAADAWNGLVMKYLCNAPLCVYVMDDQSVTTNGIPTELMAELLRVADLRLAISQEMAHAYEEKYGQRFWLVPPVVAPEFIPRTPPKPDPELLATKTGVLVGNVWSPRWLRMLRAAVRGAGIKLHWYGADKQATADRESLQADGVVPQGFLPQDEFVARLRRYPFAVVATSPLDGDTADESPEARAIARLSLPSRLPFLLAATHTPVVVLGSPETTAARFVERFDLGAVCPYAATPLRAAVERLTEPAQQAAARSRAARLAPGFSAEPVVDWIWRSLELGGPADDRFERLMPRRADEGGTVARAA